MLLFISFYLQMQPKGKSCICDPSITDKSLIPIDLIPALKKDI